MNPKSINIRNQHHQPPLIRLPPDVRHEIHESTLGNHIFELLSIAANDIKPKRLPSNTQGPKSLRLTCRLIHHETYRMQYAATETFGFSKPKSSAVWSWDNQI
ncbi:hypothetical protein EJ07DRAFT_154925 [Lizonia empirigonia]|nr:hypothetical protein EJ07DRAFT_154925 [Lizonia empirigonia]